MKFALVLVATLFLAGSVKANLPLFDILSPLMCKTGLTTPQITAMQKILGCLTKLLKSVLGEDTLLKHLMVCAKLPTTSTLKAALTKVCKEGEIDASVLSCLDLKVPAVPDATSLSREDLLSASTCLTKQTGKVPALPKLPCPFTILCYLETPDPEIAFLCTDFNIVCPKPS